VIALFYVSLVVLSLVGILPLWTLLVILSLPLAVKSVRHLWKNHADPMTVVPAQASTIQFQIVTALMVIIAVVVDKFI
jgi:1,4-dihydroxy-2-naphthoate octaprenyltransferase